MAKITLQEPDGPYSCVIDSGVMLVKIEETFVGVRFETQEGERLSVSMRDGGFELHYTGNVKKKGFRNKVGFDAGWFEFKQGHLTRRKKC